MTRFLTGLTLMLTAATALAGGSKASAPTVPSMEIDVLDPNRDPQGNPKAIPVLQPNGLKTIEIPPTVLVHKLYFTGERSFQGPYIPGGPSIVVATHPKTGVRVYVPVQMHPGYPRVKYTGSSIEYDYGPQSITVHFGHGDPKVIYTQQDKFSVAAGKTLSAVGTGARNLYAHTELSTTFTKLKAGTKNVFVNATDKATAATKQVAAPFVKLLSAMPGAKLFSDSASGDERMKDAQLRKREAEDQIKKLPYLKTNR